MSVYVYRSSSRIFQTALWLSALAWTVCGQSADLPASGAQELLFIVSVTDNRGFPVKELRPGHFKILSDRKPQEVTVFKEEEEPASIAFLIDTSGSMQGDLKNGSILSHIANGFEDFLQSSHEANEYAILSFNKEIRQTLAWTKDRRKVIGAIATLAAQPVSGYTSFYDACYQSLELMRQRANRKRVVILISDGTDNSSKKIWLSKLKEAVRNSDCLFYTINVGALYVAERSSQSIIEPRNRTFVVVNSDARELLENMAKDTGGLSFLPQNFAEIMGAFELINLILRNQYVIGFNVNQMDGKWHDIKVKLKLPPDVPRELKSLLIRNRTGYLANFNRVAQTP